MFFNYNISSVVDELNRISKLREFAGFEGEIMSVDATFSACDFNYDKQYIPPEHLEKLNFKWSYSEIKGSFIGFKVTVTLNKDILILVSILIRHGAPYYSRLFEEILDV